MNIHPVLIAGGWRQAAGPRGTFRALDPATGEDLPGDYPVSDRNDVEDALRAGQEAALAMMGLPPDPIAAFLEAYAAGIDRRAGETAAMACRETGLALAPRLLSVELPRTVFQLRQAAACARERSWCRAIIDTKADIRSKLGPLGGPVAVFGPNNFPLAYNSIAGTDFASALAAGNPVIAKGHPFHPGTTRLLAEICFEALRTSGLPPAAAQLIYHLGPNDGFALVSHPLLGASAFTGSRPGGMALKAAADAAGKPIYVETSSVNPVFLLPRALRERAEEIAAELFGSCTLGAGQFCTQPGIIVLCSDEAGRAFFDLLAGRFRASEAGQLLGKTVLDGMEAAIEAMTAAGAEVVAGGRRIDGPGFRFENTLLRVSGDRFLREPKPLQQEAFGAVSLCVLAASADDILAVAKKLDGNLTGSIYSAGDGSDDGLVRRLEPVLRTKVGRLLNDKVPTGVTVTAAMVHGGPYPATGHPGYTSVGYPASMLRFAALHGYDHVRPERLPEELRDANPTGRMWRLIDGEWTQRDAGRPPQP
jgi:alpha-ketoglutaric semialdehyde dehydrogenase